MNFKKFVSSQKWKEFTRTFPKIDYKYKQTLRPDNGIKTLLDLYDKIDNENSEEIPKLGGYLERSLAYDAVWTIAYALNKTLN